MRVHVVFADDLHRSALSTGEDFNLLDGTSIRPSLLGDNKRGCARRRVSLTVIGHQHIDPTGRINSGFLAVEEPSNHPRDRCHPASALRASPNNCRLIENERFNEGRRRSDWDGTVKRVSDLASLHRRDNDQAYRILEPLAVRKQSSWMQGQRRKCVRLQPWGSKSLASLVKELSADYQIVNDRDRFGIHL